MSDSEYFQTQCEHCGGAVEVLRASSGAKVSCPHCSREMLISKRGLKGIWVGVLIALLIAAAAFAYVRYNKKPGSEVRVSAPMVETNTPSTSSVAEVKPKTRDDLKIGSVELEQPKGSGLRYAVGTLKNDSDHARYGINIELSLFDQRGQQLPRKASDYLQTLEPRKEWRFRALVLESKAVSAKVASVREEE
jgi:ribosomal protein S27E